MKKSKKAPHKFSVGDKVVFRSQKLIIECIDYTRNVYIFDKKLIYAFSKLTSLGFESADKIFELCEQ